MNYKKENNLKFLNKNVAPLLNFFVLSVIITGDMTELAALHHNNHVNYVR